MAPYTPTAWINNQAPAMSAANLNKLTDELESQAAAKSVSHTLPNWVNGSAPAITDAGPWNEMERVLHQVALAVGLGYTKTVWENGWTPARNAARLNKMEQQAVLNRNAIDTPSATSKPLSYIQLAGGLWPPSHANDYALIIGPLGADQSTFSGRRLKYVSSVSCAISGSQFGVSYQTAHDNGWLLTDGSGEMLNVSHPTNYLGNAGLDAYRASWCANVESMLASEGGLDGVFIDDTQAYIQTISGGRTPSQYPTEASWYNAIVGFCAYVYAYFQPRGKYISFNARNWKAGAGDSDDPALRTTTFWTDLGPHSDGLMYEYWMAHSAWPDNRIRRLNNYWDSARNLHTLCQNLGVDFLPLDETGSSTNDALHKLYSRATFLLNWNGSSSSHIWVPPNNTDPWSTLDTTIMALGQPTGAMTVSGDTRSRSFQNGTVTVNPVAGTASIG